MSQETKNERVPVVPVEGWGWVAVPGVTSRSEPARRDPDRTVHRLY